MVETTNQFLYEPNYNARYDGGSFHPDISFFTEEQLDTPLFVFNLSGMLPYPKHGSVVLIKVVTPLNL